MNIEDKLRAAFDESFPAASPDETDQTYQMFLDRYYAKPATGQRLKALDDAAAAVELGYAAYFTGVHLAACGRDDDAEYWLRIAAERDVGDATFRLARICEQAAVSAIEDIAGGVRQVDGLADERFSEAHYWYRRAARSGYAVEDYRFGEPLELPSLPFDCCSSMRAIHLEEEAREALVDAAREKSEMLRSARHDVTHILDGARHEVDQLARRHQRISAQLTEFEAATHSLEEFGRRPVLAGVHLIVLIVTGLFSKRIRRELSRITSAYALSKWLFEEVPEETPARLPSPPQDRASLSGAGVEPPDPAGADQHERITKVARMRNNRSFGRSSREGELAHRS